MVSQSAGLNPYVGPRPCTREDVESGRELFGRDWEGSELLDLLIGKRIVLLYSPSGAGKTSLIQAKLIPLLEKEQFAVLPVIRVGLAPFHVAGQVSNRSCGNRYVFSALRSLDAQLPEEQQTSPTELANMKLETYLERWSAAGNAASQV